MNNSRHGISSLFTSSLVSIIIFGFVNSALANPNQILAEGKESTPPKNVDADTTKEDNNDAKPQPEPQSELQEKDDDVEASTNQELSIINLKNALFLFLVVDLPIFTLLLTLWFLNSKQQKEKFDRLTKKQGVITQKLNQLDTISTKIGSLDKDLNNINKRIKDNKEEITNSRLTLLESLNKKPIHQPISNYDNTGINLNNHYGFSTSTTDQVEPQLDVTSYNPVAVADPVPQFVKKYNLDKSTLFNEAIANVVTTKASINKRRLGGESKLTLEDTTLKKYLIVQEDNDYYLIQRFASKQGTIRCFKKDDK